MDAGDLYKVTLNFNMPEATIAQNVFHYSVVNADPFLSDLQLLTDIVASLKVGWDLVAGRVSDEISGNLADLAIYDPILGTWTGVATISMATWLGLNLNDPTPNGVAVLLKFFTAVARSQGRKYFAGMTDVTFLGNVVEPAAVANFLLLGANWVSTIVSGTGAVSPGNFVALGGGFRLWAGALAVAGINAYQRRRKPGVGI